ncbi:hypothetical protein [Pedobacter heparinus]|uniref:hypothetical protein n=1 Tax=Pedobacter heparinus TaxID=984 RepID=UPI002930BA7B|nr:hypothetical protein [Pedobacter heparinus]
MFRKLTFAVFIMISLAFVQAERYYVTFIKGTVILKKTGKPLKIGDALLSTDALVFKESSGKVSCISPGKGRFDINAAKIVGGGKSELLAVLKSNLVPSTSTYRLSTRSMMFEGNDPVTYFSSLETQDRILLIENEPFIVKPIYKLDASNFFFLQYPVNGNLTTHKIEHTDRGLLFSGKLLATPSGPVTLCYQSDTDGKAKSSALAKFYPVLANKEEITKQIELIKSAYGTTDKKKLKTEVTGHLFDNYGKIGGEELSRVFGI